MKLYYPKDLYDPNSKKRFALFPLLKVFISRENQTKSASKLFDVVDQDMGLVDNIEKANVFILPMSWDYYVTENREKEATSFINRIKVLGKKVHVFISGDFGVRITNFSNILVYRCSGYKSRLPNTHLGMPVFINNPLMRYYQSNLPFLNLYKPIPTSGFCGLASGSMKENLLNCSKVIYRNLSYYFGASKFSPQKIRSNPYIRHKILKRLEKSSLLKTNFILREKYGAGIVHGRGVTQVAKEYFENMRTSDYVLCYRGAGNFSTRFYETLAMGRIPVYINTDGLIPLSNDLNWKNHVVWIEESEIKLIDKKIMEFHQNLNANSFKELQLENYKIWKEQLNLWSFFYFNFQRFSN